LQNRLAKTEHYSPAEDTIFFANYIEREKGNNALDIGTGSGYLAKVLLPNFNLVVATDISFDSIKKAHTVIDNCVCCNAADALCIDFDLIICNMPYLPSDEITDVAVDGLNEGVKVPLEIIKAARGVLKEKGKMIFLTSSLANYEKLSTLTESLGFHVKIVATKKMFFEELILIEAIK
jgi:release factor glutamine methyltransferase